MNYFLATFSEGFTEWINDNVNLLWSIGGLLVILILCFVLHKILKDKKTSAVTTKDITYGAVCISISFALSFFGFTMPQGGTITPASVLPIMIYCYFFGFKKGSIVVVAFTILQLLQAKYLLFPMQIVVDYILPYLALIVVGIFSYKYKACANGVISRHKSFFIGALLYVIIRLTSHILSGAIFFSEYAWDGWGAWAYSIVYNATWFIPDAALAICAGAALLSSKAFNTYMASSLNTLQNPDTCAKQN